MEWWLKMTCAWLGINVLIVIWALIVNWGTLRSKKSGSEGEEKKEDEED